METLKTELENETLFILWKGQSRHYIYFHSCILMTWEHMTKISLCDVLSIAIDCSNSVDLLQLPQIIALLINKSNLKLCVEINIGQCIINYMGVMANIHNENLFNATQRHILY